MKIVDRFLKYWPDVSGPVCRIVVEEPLSLITCEGEAPCEMVFDVATYEKAMFYKGGDHFFVWELKGVPPDVEIVENDVLDAAKQWGGTY